MDPKYQVGDRVDHKTVLCKKNGVVIDIFERTVYVLYGIKWCACKGDFYENELVPAGNSVLETEREDE